MESTAGEAMSKIFLTLFFPTLLRLRRPTNAWTSIFSTILAIFLFCLGVRAQDAAGKASLSAPQVTASGAGVVGAGVVGANNAIHPDMRKNVDLVLVPVTVTDPLQRLVTGLQSNNFQIFENGKEQRIKHFSSEDAPVSVGLIVDTSGSMANKIESAREAVKELYTSANPQDEYFVITFADEPHLVHDFADPPEELETGLAFTNPKGRTALLDAIYLGLQKMREARYGKKALLIISDGGDNHSRYSERELKSMVKESDVTIYAIGIFDRYMPTPEEMLGPELLSDIAEASGGRAFMLDKIVEMPKLARRIGIELRTQYVLGYAPENRPHNGKWQKIKIKLRIPKDIPYLQARAKTGYYAANE
jgi:Ca-activated chloride channel homolog